MDQMNQNIDLVNITEFASMLRCSKSLVRLRLTERRQGIGDILNAIPAPLATRPKQRLYWLRSECVRYIERLNATAKGTICSRIFCRIPGVITWSSGYRQFRRGTMLCRWRGGTSKLGNGSPCSFGSWKNRSMQGIV